MTLQSSLNGLLEDHQIITKDASIIMQKLIIFRKVMYTFVSTNNLKHAGTRFKKVNLICVSVSLLNANHIK